jgi:NADPH:quinone reductase-like Zn-dependent oxidoreductase
VIAESMKALVLDESGELARLDRPVPRPGRGQVLVRMHALPINRSDLLFIEGNYEVTKPRPVVPGFEGSGRVVAAGGGLVGRLLNGRRVAAFAGDGDGTWAEYMCTEATRCAPLARATELDQGAMLLANPITASILIERARRHVGKGFVQNAAAGALGRMLIRLAARRDLAVVNVVRRDEQAEALRAIGAEHVVVSAGDFAGELRALCERLDIRFGLDAIGGDATGDLVAALGRGGTVLVYGMLSGEPCRMSADDLVFGRKTVAGFTMYEWVESTSMLAKLRVMRAAQRRLGDDLATEIRDKVPLAGFARALELARTGTSEGKILFDLS